MAVYKCKLADYSKVAVYKCKLVDYNKVAVYKSKPAVYTCKVLNSRFTTVLLVTFAGHCGGNTFLSNFLFCKAVVYMCKPVVYRCKLLLYYKPPLYKL